MKLVEVEQKEEILRQWIVKPAVLPNIPLVLKKAWKANQIQLETAGVFEYLCNMQIYTKVAFVNHVLQFLKTYSMGIKTAKVNGRMVQFFVQALGRIVSLPIEGITEGQLLAITKKQHETIF